jgi:hypothetical protein
MLHLFFSFLSFFFFKENTPGKKHTCLLPIQHSPSYSGSLHTCTAGGLAAEWPPYVHWVSQAQTPPWISRTSTLASSLVATALLCLFYGIVLGGRSLPWSQLSTVSWARTSLEVHLSPKTGIVPGKEVRKPDRGCCPQQTLNAPCFLSLCCNCQDFQAMLNTAVVSLVLHYRSDLLST